MRSADLEHLLRLMVGLLIVLATILLGIGDRSITLSLISIAMLAVSAYFTDFTQRFRLNQSTANCAALAVMGLSAANAYYLDRNGQLVAMANLQSYLQYVLLFQAKTPRVYWQLALLSLGQVAIASTLVPGPMFGGMLLLYLFVGIITFVLLLLQSESQRFASRVSRPAGAAADAAPQANDSFLLRRAPLLSGNSATSAGVVGWALVQQAVFIVLSSVVVTVIVFALLPRWDVQNRQTATTEALRTVGFSKKVTLGELGDVVNNSDVVMRIQFFRGRGNRPFRLVGDPLFRGTVVTRYERRVWTQASAGVPLPVPIDSKSRFVRQRITIEPLDVPELCCVCPVFALDSDPRLRLNPVREELLRQEDYRDEKMDFEIATTGIVGSSQSKFLPCEKSLEEDQQGDLLQMPIDRRRNADPFPGLRETAARVLREANLDPQQDRVAAARALDEYLRASGTYFYSLEPQQRDADLDPLEDFVTMHRRGHCEYFAGALVLMLRSQGIPARMAIGFKGGEWNSLGNYYQVQQLHAHTWVEVYLQQEHVPANAFVGDESPPSAAWLVLDPTEGTQEGNLAEQSRGLVARVRQYMDYGQVLWSNYVVGMNSRRQQQGIVEPLAQAVNAAVESVISPEVWHDRFRRLGRTPLGTFWDWYRRHWFSWRGGLVAVGFSAMIVVCYWTFGWTTRLLRRLGLIRGKQALHEKPVLEMYRRLEAALSRRGLNRQPGQTAYEFALAAGGDLAEQIEHRRVAHLPRRIVEAFYRVRFGRQTLDNQEADAVEHALVELELVLGRPG